MKLEINDNLIIYNGQKFVPEKAEPEFKVGGWYIYSDSLIPEARIFRVIKSEKEGVQYDCHNGETGYFDIGSMRSKKSRPATREEIESHLRKVCDEKGYKKGMKVKDANDGLISVIIENEPKEYRPKYDSLVIRSKGIDHDFTVTNLYYNGEFASILPDLKKRPETKEEYNQFLFEYDDWNENHRSIKNTVFLDQYDIR